MVEWESVKPDPLKLKKCQLIHFIRWVGGRIRADPGEADTVRVRYCVRWVGGIMSVSIGPGPGEAEVVRAAP